MAMPSRTYNIMAAGKPILALTERNSELAQVIDEEGIGRHVESGDVGGFLSAILSLYDSRVDLDIMGRNARNAAVRKYSLSKAIEAYAKALK